MTPASTYRLQCNAGFDLRAAAALVPYLRSLGVDWVYLSPVFAATAGSAHGYDVTDPTVVNPELGGRGALDAFACTAHAAGLRVLLDIVPNHQAANDENRHWRAARDAREPGWFDATWRDGELQHRRFFDIGDLVGVRVEDPEVFRATHELTFELLRSGVVDGLRVDHVDGLADPAGYLERLRREVGDAFVVVEKILARDETLPPWPVAGTTGYEAGAALTELLVEPDGRGRLERALLAENGGDGFEAVERAAKELVLDQLFAPEWNRLRELLDDDALTPALREVIVALDVYRTYDATAVDRSRLRRAARALDPGTGAAIVDRLAGAPGTELATRFQQLSGAVMAKGHEDTACYRYPALLAQNEVGGDPGASARDAVERFHACATGYRGLVGTSTHDSKRSEDVRARLCVLSERPDAFESGLARWRRLVAPGVVTPVELRFVAQTLLGAWPLYEHELPGLEPRIVEYLRKALREAKDRTSWTAPDEEHERAVIETACRSVAAGGRAVREAFGALVDDVCFFGALNSLAMLTWKLGMPGTADVYRGCELWDFSLVDPDNRRPVDFAHRRRLLASVHRAEPQQLLAEWRTGAVKLAVTAAGLRARRRHGALFTEGEHVPVECPPGIFAFARRHRDRWAVAIAPRHATTVTTRGRWPLGAAVWGDARITLPDARGTVIAVADALRSLPVALMVLSAPAL